jgi:hypothetical protein
MSKSAFRIRKGMLFTAVLPWVYIAAAHAQSHPILDRVADKVLQKYQSSSCQQLTTEREASKKGKKAEAGKEEVEAQLVRMLREDAGMRKEFLDRVAAPVADKLLECGMIP